MKKVSGVCLGMVVVLVSFIILNIFRTNDAIRVNTIERTEFSFSIYIRESIRTNQDVLVFFQQLSEKHDISIFRTEEEIERTLKAAIVSERTFPYHNFNLEKRELFSNGHEQYATFELKNATARIPVFMDSRELILQSMTTYFQENKPSVNGVYTLTSTEPFNQTKVLSEIGTFFGTEKDDLLRSNVVEHQEWLNRDILLCFAFIGFIILILLLVLVYHPISEMKKIGVMKLNGSKDRHVVMSFLKNDVLIFIGCIASTDLLFLVLIDYTPANFWQILTLSQIAILIGYFLLYLMTWIIIKKITIARLLSGFVNFKVGIYLGYVIKVGICVLMTVLLIQLSLTFSSISKQKKYNELWLNQGDLITLENVILQGEFEQSFRLGNEDYYGKYADIYEGVVKETNAMYILSEQILPLENFADESKGHSFRSSDSYHVMTVNQAYLDEQGLFDTNHEKRNGRRFYVPAIYQSEAEKMAEFCQLLLLNRMSEPDKSNKVVENPDVDIVFYDETVEVFPYHTQFNQMIKNPIFSLVDSENMTWIERAYLATTGENNPIKIKNTLGNRKKLTELLAKDAEVFHFSSIRSILNHHLNGLGLNLQVTQILIIGVLLINVIATLLLVTCMIQSRKKELGVQKLLGIKLLDRYRIECIILGMIGMIQLIVPFIFGGSWLTLLWTSSLFVLDMCIFFISIYHQEKKGLVTHLKGA